MTLGWNDERVETLRKLWTDGLSASQIAKQLGGVTRNAVIGKVHRLGLAGRATPSRPAKRPMRLARPPRPHNALSGPPRPRTHAALTPVPFTPAPPPLDPLAQPDGSVASVLTLTDRMCKWPIGDPNDSGFAFCGREADCGPYCQEHAQHAYQPAQAKKRKAAGEPDELRRTLRLASM
jgi:GcrA cell cycle regulator